MNFLLAPGHPIAIERTGGPRQSRPDVARANLEHVGLTKKQANRCPRKFVTSWRPSGMQASKRYRAQAKAPTENLSIQNKQVR